MTGDLMEIFTSFQGEGIWVGARQVFVRLGGCHLRCVYCDTPESWNAPKTWKLEDEVRPNPASVDQVVEAVRARAEGCHSVSVTGGEPLAQVEFLESLLPRLPLPVMLETSGTRHEDLARVAPHVGYFSLDLKPPSTPGVKMDWNDFESCVRLAAGRPAQVKVVAMAESPTPEEIGRAAGIIRSTDRSIPLVFTPATEVNGKTHAAGGERLKALVAAAEALTTHVIPQLHPIVGWR